MKISTWLSVCVFAVILSFSQAAIFGLFEQKKYTPLIMFKVPKGTSEESDAMEKVVRGVEKDLGVKVQRLDILRDRFARNLYEKIDEIEFRGKIPLLYNRESLQSIYGFESKARVSAWAKGRLNPKRRNDGETVPDAFIGDEEQGDFMEQELTELQQSGRDKMLERLENETEEE